MAEPDFLDTIQAGRDALRRMQESFARYTMSAEQRQAVLDGISQLMFPTDAVKAMSDMMDAFGPPLAQIEALRAELAEQRQQLSELDDRLAHIEITAERLALAGEQIVAYQEPFANIMALMTGQGLRRGSSDSSADRADETPADTDDGQKAGPEKAGPKKTSSKKAGAKRAGSKKAG